MASVILLNLFVIVTFAVIAYANGAGYKLLEYGEEFPAHPRQTIVKRGGWTWDNKWDPNMTDPSQEDYRYPSDFDRNSNAQTEAPQTKRKSSFKEINELNNFPKEAGVKVIYGRLPMPVILVSYPEPKQ